MNRNTDLADGLRYGPELRNELKACQALPERHEHKHVHLGALHAPVLKGIQYLLAARCLGRNVIEFLKDRLKRCLNGL